MKRYKVGDIVQIRQWDDMVKEFGVNYYGVIRCNNCGFVREMKKYCGQKLRIAAINNFDDTYYYLNSVHSWTFTSEMFEKGDLSFTREMNWFCGMIFTIKNVRSGIFRVTYDLETNNKELNDEIKHYYWDEEMLTSAGLLAQIIQRRKTHV